MTLTISEIDADDLVRQVRDTIGDPGVFCTYDYLLSDGETCLAVFSDYPHQVSEILAAATGRSWVSETCTSSQRQSVISYSADVMVSRER